MKAVHLAAVAATMLIAGQASAADTAATDSATVKVEPSADSGAVAAPAQPVRLSAAELDRVTAGDLGLPNGMILFEGFDNAAPGEFHPNFDRSATGIAMSSNNEGPWSAHYSSPVIDCPSC